MLDLARSYIRKIFSSKVLLLTMNCFCLNIPFLSLFVQDKLMTAPAETSSGGSTGSWLFKNKEHGKASAAASLVRSLCLLLGMIKTFIDIQYVITSIFIESAYSLFIFGDDPFVGCGLGSFTN